MLIKLTFVYAFVAVLMVRTTDARISAGKLKNRRSPRQYYYQGLPVQYPTNNGPYVVPRCYYFIPCAASPCKGRCYNPPSPGAEIIISLPETKFPTKKPQACRCDAAGSKYASCDPTTGNCICKHNYQGRTCDTCKEGFWKTFKNDCIKCHCNEKGSMDSLCHPETGQCKCRPGVTGQNCDKCMDTHYGTVETGCIECEPCTKPGHVCGKGGKCVCPDLTIGKECNHCATYAYNFEYKLGCKACNCSVAGSSSLQCHQESGTCFCKPGYAGEKCTSCDFGYYGYPNCRKCNCNADGTIPQLCRDEECQCDDDGQCTCKENVLGPKCATCKEGTFGLRGDNKYGCMECFCFHRSKTCTDTGYSWDKIRDPKSVHKQEAASSEFISLPRQFTGDLTTSYGGYLSINSSGGQFTVFINGNSVSLQSVVTNAEIKLHQKHWHVTSRNVPRRCHTSFTRECFLVVLQNVTSIIVQGQEMHFRITEVLLDSAKPYIPYNRTSHTIEKCECPPEYTGLSCQDPNEGYYRYFPGPQEVTKNPWIDRIIGVAKLCDCNGRSTECDPSSGHCKNCSDDTTGAHCDLCAPGHYNHSHRCLSCPCPSENANNAESCSPHRHGFICNCKQGYSGSKCDMCEDEYYQDRSNGKCKPCACHKYGSSSAICSMSGQCDCRPGFRGEKCNECSHPREYIKDGICIPCEEDTQILFRDIDELTALVNNALKMFDDGIDVPWKVLTDVKTKYQNLSSIYDRRRKVHQFLENNAIEELTNKLVTLQKKIVDNIKEAQDNLENTKANIVRLKKSNDTLIILHDKLRNIINSLKESGKKHENVKQVIERSEFILDQIKDISQKIDKQESENGKVFLYCENVSKKLEEYYMPMNITLPYNRLKDINDRLDDINRESRKVEEDTVKVELQNINNAERLQQLRKTIEKLNGLQKDHENSIDEIEDKLNNIKDMYLQLQNLNEQMKNFNFTDMDILQNEVDTYEREKDGLVELVETARKHAEDVMRVIQQYENMLNFTKDEWRTINASSAYEDIVKGVKEAEDIANEAKNILQKALEIIEPKDSDSLRDKANLEHATSDRLKQRIVNLKLKDISNNFNNIKKRIDDFKYQLIQSGNENNKLNKKLLDLENQLTRGRYVDELNEVIQNSSKVSDDIRAVDKDLSNLNLTSQYGIFKDFKLYKELTSETELHKTRDEMKMTREKLNEIDRLLKEGKSRGDNETEPPSSLESVSAKIRELQKAVLIARQMAETVDIAVSLSNCSMTYPIPQTKIFRNLAITFNCQNCQLFRWDSGEDYMSLRIVNGVAVVYFNEKEMIRTTKPLNNSMETTVLLTRTGSLLEIKFDDENTWSKKTVPNKFLLMYPNDYIQLGSGGTVADTSYIYKVSINERDVGLWKSVNISGSCKGHDRINAQNVDTAKPFYIGDGYKLLSIDSSVKPNEFSLRFDFATFDEESILYFAQDQDNPCSFIALSLIDGYLKLEVVHKNGQKVPLTIQVKHNDGNDHYAIISMYYSNRMQHYSLKSDLDTVTTEKTLDTSAVFRLRKSQHFVGGLSANVDKKCIDFPATSFLGILREDSHLSKESISTGVIMKSATDRLELAEASFQGKGLIRLNFLLTSTKANTKLHNIAFSLIPLNGSSAIVNITNFCTISLKDTLLHIDLLNDDEPYIIDKSLNINEYNWIAITFKKDKIVVNVNGEDKIVHRSKTETLPIQESVDMTLGQSEGHDSLHGTIGDILINDEKLLFNADTVKYFTNVKIGREQSLISRKIILKDLAIPTPVNTMQNTERCAPSSSYYIEPSAVSFGDKPESFIQIQSNFWKRDFNLEFDFRTFEPDGLLFVLSGTGNQPHYNLLELKNGLITLSVRGRKKLAKNWPIIFSKSAHDGYWHTMKISKKNGKKLHVSLDEETKKPVRVPKTVTTNEIFFGGVPNGYTDSKELKEKLRPFRGCIRNLNINNEAKLQQNNLKNIRYSNIRQCFPKIEQGAYFGGDAYGIYKRKFSINKLLEFSFDFRTGEQNGILLTAARPNDYPAIYVELKEGAVVMTFNLGNGMESNVTNNLNSDFALCNNMWHEVIASYSTTTSELTVIVDGIRKSWVQNGAYSIIEEMEAPLFIGGLPEHTGSARSTENFKGCIRNLKVEGKTTEWLEMEYLNNVLLNSCPVP